MTDGRHDIEVSAKSGAGVSDLLTMISRRAAAATDTHGGIIPARTRHVALLRDAARSLAAAVGLREVGLELRAEELRRAADSFGRIAGAIDAEDVLGAIFSEFCIGK